MKKQWIGALALGALLAAGGAYAMGPGGDDEQRGPGGPGMEALEEQKEALGLSADQVKELKAMKAGRRDDKKKHHRQMRALMGKLEDQVDDKASDKDIDATLASLKQLRKDQQAEMEKLREQGEAILTPTQRAKLILNRKAKMMQGGRLGKGMRGEDRGGKGEARPGDMKDKD